MAKLRSGPLGVKSPLRPTSTCSPPTPPSTQACPISSPIPVNLRNAVAYLRRTDRTLTASDLTREQREAAVGALREAYGPTFAEQVSQLPAPGGDEDRLIAVAYDVSTGGDSGGAIAQMRRQHDIVQELWADQREDATAVARSTARTQRVSAPRRLTDELVG